MILVYRASIVFFALLCMTSCDDWEPDIIVQSIPEEDRFIFETGDALIYACSDKSVDTVWVQEYKFKTETMIADDWLGIERTYRIDHSRVTLAIEDRTWLRLLHLACHIPEGCSSCVGIKTEGFNEDTPMTIVYLGCESYGGLIFAYGWNNPNTKIINGRAYYNVYSHSHYPSESEGFSMDWSLKYGIIHFEGEAEGSFYSWDLEIP